MVQLPQRTATAGLLTTSTRRSSVRWDSTELSLIRLLCRTSTQRHLLRMSTSTISLSLLATGTSSRSSLCSVREWSRMLTFLHAARSLKTPSGTMIMLQYSTPPAGTARRMALKASTTCRLCSTSACNCCHDVSLTSWHRSRTNIQNAYASVMFTGNTISIYGCTSANHGFYSVSLDSAEPLVLNGTIPDGIPNRYQNLLVSSYIRYTSLGPVE